jgi:hypothetical protein
MQRMDSVTVEGQVKENDCFWLVNYKIGRGDGPGDGILIVSHLI